MPRPSFDKRRKKDDFEKKERFLRKRFCRFCKHPDLVIDYRDGRALASFVSERGRIMPRRITSNCAYHQRELTVAIKRARILALLPYSASQIK